MKREAIKGLVAVFLAFLITMGILPGGITPLVYSSSDARPGAPPSLEENLKLLEEGMDIPMTIKPTSIVTDWSTEAHLIYSKSVESLTTTTNFFAGVYTSNYYKGVSANILVTSPVVYYNHWTSAWVGCFNGNVWLQAGWVKEAGVGAKPRVFYTGTPYVWRAQIYYNGSWITLKDVSISNVSSIASCSFAECYAADGTVEAGQLPRGMNVNGSIYNGSSWNTWTSAYSTVLKWDAPLYCVVRNPYYNIEYWGP